MFFIFPTNAPKELTSSLGEGGIIELWIDGQTHDKDSKIRKLAGGTITAPYTYAVPYGKEVTYRMTPEEDYILDKLFYYILFFKMKHHSKIPYLQNRTIFILLIYMIQHHALLKLAMRVLET